MYRQTVDGGLRNQLRHYPNGTDTLSYQTNWDILEVDEAYFSYRGKTTSAGYGRQCVEKATDSSLCDSRSWPEDLSTFVQQDTTETMSTLQ
mgnify:FL=1